MSFNIGLSGLNAASTSLNTTGNNIANVGTTGFKSARAEFGDMYANSLFLGSGRYKVGSGVSTQAISQQFTQGNVTTTGASLDLAINGNGFFITSNNGSNSYTRAGAFGTDSSGNIVDANGNRLQGYGVNADGDLVSGVLTDLTVSTAAVSPKATSNLTETVNLNSSDTVPSESPFDASNSKSYNYTFATDVYDSQGNKHSLNQYFVKTDTNAWSMYVTVDGVNPADPSSTEPYSADLSFSSAGALVGSTSDDFTVGSLGKLTLTNWVPASQNADGDMVANGASPASGGMLLDVVATTQYNTTSAQTAKVVDGYAPGSLSSLSIDADGYLFGTYSNGQSKVIGQVALANFANMQGLTPSGSTSWKESYASGVPVVGAPNSGVMGDITAGALEDSNVDLTSELVNLIKAQTNYQANAKTISTESTLMQTILQMT
ncbi:flagellar hook protein FlgE [Pseudomonas putida]|uniref:Flagellar hook protein FlgE n=1 Tax=Pseudomonas putida TaxID=303 RepID=A0AAW6PZD2_PSEPU|nr:flagellar hook protein FlgE [Pseudomonas putida]MDF3874037.1 flagellar hook protein FlgE [Pseudomonas putida]MDF3877255.1 flagellar hook protein FlgE [Pseudomonas putida]